VDGITYLGRTTRSPTSVFYNTTLSQAGFQERRNVSVSPTIMAPQEPQAQCSDQRPGIEHDYVDTFYLRQHYSNCLDHDIGTGALASTTPLFPFLSSSSSLYQIRIVSQTMGGPMCIHGYAGEYPKYLSNFSNHMNLRLNCIKPKPSVNTVVLVGCWLEQANLCKHVLGSNHGFLTLFFYFSF
jgi:hypothetical protein